MSAEEYISELLEERDTLDPVRYGHAIRMINDEIRRVENTEGRRMPVQAAPPPPPQREHRPPPQIVDVQPPPQEVYPPYEEEVVKLTEKIMLPLTEYPKFNFVGRLLGPGGSIIKGISEATGTRVSILGKGSMKDKAKEEELAKSEDPKHAHFKEAMHVSVTVEAPKSDAHMRVADALDCIQKALLPTPKDEMYDPMADMGFEQPADGYRDGHRGAPPPRGASPPRGGGGGRGRGRGRGGGGGGRSERPPPRDEYPPRYDDSGPSRYEGRGGYRGGDKRSAPAEGGYATKKYRDDPYGDPYAKVDPYAQTSRY
jgi:hypothetical protein